MSCQPARQLLDAYVDGELDLVRSLEIEQHLKTCPTCAKAYQNLQAMRSGLRSALPYFQAPPQLRQRLRLEISRTQARPPTNWRWLARAAMVAVAIGLAAWVLSSLGNRRGADLLAQQLVASHVRSLMVDHLADVPSSDQHTVKPWFEGKLDYSPPVKNLADQGFALVGGRLDYIDNRPVAALVYRYRHHVINLFVWPTTGNPSQGEQILSRQGFTLVHWTQGAMSYWAVSDAAPPTLQTFAASLRQPTPTTEP